MKTYACAAMVAVCALAACDEEDAPTSPGPVVPVDTTERMALLAPAGGQTYHLGDTVPVSVEYVNSADTSHFVTFWFSPDNGETMDFTLFDRSIRYHGQRFDTTWVVPVDSYYVADSATIRVEDYTRRQVVFAYCARPFTILP